MGISLPKGLIVPFFVLNSTPYLVLYFTAFCQKTCISCRDSSSLSVITKLMFLNQDESNFFWQLYTLKEEALQQQLQTSSSITHFVKYYNSIVSIIAFNESAEFLSFTASSPFRLIGISDSTPSAPTITGMLNETPSMP